MNNEAINIGWCVAIGFILALSFYLISKYLRKGRAKGMKKLNTNLFSKLFNNLNQGNKGLEESVSHSFSDEYRQVENIIPDEKINKDRVNYFEDLLKRNDALVVRTSIDYKMITRSAKTEGQYQSTSYTSYENKELKGLANDDQYLNQGEMSKALSLWCKEVLETHKAENTAEITQELKTLIHEFADNEMDKDCHLDSINDYSSPLEFYSSNITGNGEQEFKNFLKEQYGLSEEDTQKVHSEVIKEIETKCADIQTNTPSIKDKIIDMYSEELPGIKHITEKTATIIDNLNEVKGHVHTLKEIKELHNEIGKKLEGSSNKDDLQEFKSLNEVVDDIKQAKLTSKQDQAHEKAMSNQLVKSNVMEM